MQGFKLRFSSTLLLTILSSLLVLSVILSVFGLRHNNLKLITLREAVVVADKNGQDAQIDLALRDLRSHVINHMNADLGQGSSIIQLPYKYYRDSLALYQREAQVLNNSDSLALLQLAGDACLAEIDTVGVGCIQKYLINNQQAPGQNQLRPVIENINANLDNILPQDYYRFSYTSPGWSPDLAGLSIASAVISAIGLLASLTGRAIIRRKRQSDKS